MKPLFAGTLGAIVLCLGCSGQPAAKRTETQLVEAARQAAPAKVAGQAAAPKEAETARKIKYTADVRVICEDFDKALAGLKAAVAEHKAVVAHSEITGSPGGIRGGTWRIRVPLDRFDPFREAVRQLGEVEKDTQDSEDLTEEYYDLEAHIKNRQAEEESLRRLLEKAGDEKIENILAIRRELAQVRDDINRKQGRLRLLANLTELTTVTVAIRAKRKFDPDRPPQVAEVPTFPMRVRKTFADSTEALTSFVQFVVLAVIALAPWLLVAAVVTIPPILLMRRVWRSRRTKPNQSGA